MKAVRSSIVLGGSAILLVASLSACTSVPHEAYPAEKGWRLAHPDREVSAVEVLPMVDSASDCRAHQQGSDSSRSWALVHVSRPRSIDYRVVELASADALHQSGQAYFVNIERCEKLVAVPASN